MRLRSISLHNWKSYRRSRIDFPDPGNGRNVVIIKGNNGAGKTSLLEAMVLCLYGRLGLGLVARAAEGSRPDQSYDSFLERALNAGGRGAAARISIMMEFEAPDEEISIERIWYFNASGRHRGDDEEVRILAGRDADVVALPDPPEREPFVRDFVARHLLPEHLARFFILDGEHLERMAGKAIDEQVRSAVEAALGAPTLRSLASDLKAYARDRRRQLPQGVDSAVGVATEALAALEAEERATADNVATLMRELAPLRGERDEIVRRIGSLHGDSYASFKNLFEEREQVVRQRDSQQDELRRLLSGDLALALAGSDLRHRAIAQIGAEERAERWESASSSSRSKFEDFMGAIERAEPDLGKQRETLGQAWDEVWSSRPEDCAAAIRFHHLGEADRRGVVEHLERLSSVRSESIAILSRAVADADKRVLEIEREIARQRGLDGESQGLADELKEVQARIATAEAAHEARVQQLEALRLRLGEARDGVEGLLADSSSAAPILARARRADKFSDLIDQLVELALPENFNALSEAVTDAYRAMAHKTDVETICILPGGAVELLDLKGDDLRRQDASAGESQIFALAVMSALAKLAADFPIVMDTPLARLDPLHRRNMLQHFAASDRQLILLTHPAELGSDELELLESRLSGEIVIGTLESHQLKRTAVAATAGVA